MYHLFCIFFVIIIITSCAVLLNCLCLSPQILGFGHVHSPPHPMLVGERVSERLHGPSCQLPG